MGAALLALSGGTWILVLRKLPLYFAFMLSSVVHVTIPVCSWLVLGEKIYATRWTGIALVFIAAGLLSKGIHEFIEIGALGSGPWTATAFDISGVLSHDTGIGAFLRALFGYSAAPEILTLVVHLTYVVAILALYLRPVRRSSPPSQSPAPVRS